ncbi:MAG: hypothetical protein WCG77_05275 [Actinomycetes bacterium]|jgi:hypothetical protein
MRRITRRVTCLAIAILGAASVGGSAAATAAPGSAMATVHPCTVDASTGHDSADASFLDVLGFTDAGSFL